MKLSNVLYERECINSTEIYLLDGTQLLLSDTTLGRVEETESAITLFMDNDNIFIIPKKNIKDINYHKNYTEIELNNGLHYRFNY